MVSYPGNFLRLLQEQCDAKSLLKRIQNLDKDATEKRSEYAKLEEDIIAKASTLILNQEATADEIRELLESGSMKQLEERRSEMSEIRSQTVREALAGYDMLDNQITILDQDLTALEPQLKFGQVLPGGGGRRKYSRQSAGDAGGAFAAAAQEGGAAAAAALVQEDMDVDPNEPVYCTCKKVSFGQMIACENDECEIEWFHFECVGLTEQPADKWYCPACSAAKTD